MNKVGKQNIETDVLTINEVIKKFCNGSSIVFVTEHDVLIGAITEGDIKRHFRNGKYKVDLTVVNHNISYIVEPEKVSDVYARAGEIFEKSSKIHNIPVVDENGVFLYQIDRESNMFADNVRKALSIIFKGDLNSTIENSFSVFLECHDISHIVLMGGDSSILNWAKEYLSVKLLPFYSNLDVIIVENIYEHIENQEKNLILCFSEVVACYLRKIYCNNILVMSIGEMEDYYYYYKELNSIKLDTVSDFIELFGYETISICERNKYIDRIIWDLESLRINITGKNENSENFYETGLSAYSMDGLLKEDISIEKFYKILEVLQKYHYIVGKPFTRKEYIEEFIICVDKQKKSDKDGIVLQEHNILDHQLIEHMKKKENFYVVKMEDIDVDRKISNRYIQGDELKVVCMYSALMSVCYDALCILFNNVYIHKFKSGSAKININRCIENYDENGTYITVDFIEEMYGRKDFPIGRLVSDIKNCSVIRINETHIKYQSNYITEFFNTDTYGNRIVTNIPNKYMATVWLLGPCVYSGYAVPDDDTVASLLQKRLNQSNIKYRVVNLSVCGANNVWDLIDKIRETEIGVHDIAICYTVNWCNRENYYNTIVTDLDELGMLVGENGYWDSVYHYGRKGGYYC